MRRLYLFFAFLLIVCVLFGSPYAALLLNRAMGPWDASAVHHDGSISHMSFDQDMPRPDFVPVFPGAQIVQASMVTSQQWPHGAASLELAVHGSFDEVRQFYRSKLEGAGFIVADLGTPGLNAAAAAYLGVADTLSAKRTETDDVLLVQIGTEEGIVLRTRPVRVSWRKLSEWPAGQVRP